MPKQKVRSHCERLAGGRFKPPQMGYKEINRSVHTVRGRAFPLNGSCTHFAACCWRFPANATFCHQRNPVVARGTRLWPSPPDKGLVYWMAARLKHSNAKILIPGSGLSMHLGTASFVTLRVFGGHLVLDNDQVKLTWFHVTNWYYTASHWMQHDTNDLWLVFDQWFSFYTQITMQSSQHNIFLWGDFVPNHVCFRPGGLGNFQPIWLMIIQGKWLNLKHILIGFNSLRPSDVYIRRWNLQS